MMLKYELYQFWKVTTHVFNTYQIINNMNLIVFNSFNNIKVYVYKVNTIYAHKARL